MRTIGGKAFIIAIVHYLLSFVVGFLVFAVAWGAALSDSYNGDNGLGFFAILLVVLQAPVALVQWLVVRVSADGKTGLPITTLVFLGMPSSLLYGYVIAFLSRRKPSPNDNNAARP
jgi:hypothetical protein